MSKGHEAVFFLSTGRCGTQWLQTALAAVYSEVATVTHEPVRSAYNAKRYLRAKDKCDELLSSPQISQHLGHIKETLKTKTYIETGWTSYPVLPFLINKLDGQVRIVHLVRHPVFAALSLATHRIYQRPDWIRRAAINPFDQGVMQKDLAAVWYTMNIYEKCLFWWTEINLYALDLQEQYPDIKFFFLRYEDLFGVDLAVLNKLIMFMGLTYEPAIEAHKTKIVDLFQFKSAPVEWQLIFNYPRTVTLAEQFGYDLNQTPTPQISARYFEDQTINSLLGPIKQISRVVLESFKAFPSIKSVKKGRR